MDQLTGMLEFAAAAMTFAAVALPSLAHLKKRRERSRASRRGKKRVHETGKVRSRRLRVLASAVILVFVWTAGAAALVVRYVPVMPDVQSAKTISAAKREFKRRGLPSPEIRGPTEAVQDDRSVAIRDVSPAPGTRMLPWVKPSLRTTPISPPHGRYYQGNNLRQKTIAYSTSLDLRLIIPFLTVCEDGFMGIAGRIENLSEDKWITIRGYRVAGEVPPGVRVTDNKSENGVPRKYHVVHTGSHEGDLWRYFDTPKTLPPGTSADFFLLVEPPKEGIRYLVLEFNLGNDDVNFGTMGPFFFSSYHPGKFPSVVPVPHPSNR